MTYICPVCGYSLDEIPADHNICPCCGTEFGYHDAGRTHDCLRSVWIQQGAQWWSPVDQPPDGWAPLTQLLRAGFNYNLADRKSQTTHTTTVLTQQVGHWKAA